MEGDEKKLIDCHVHLAALPEGDNGCYISPKMLKSPLFRFLLWKHGLSPDKPRKPTANTWMICLSNCAPPDRCNERSCLGWTACMTMRESSPARRPISSAMITSYKPLAPIRTSSFPGVSINPQRRDAVEEVHRCADAGAALVKVLPNAQQSCRSQIHRLLSGARPTEIAVSSCR